MILYSRLTFRILILQRGPRQRGSWSTKRICGGKEYGKGTSSSKISSFKAHLRTCSTPLCQRFPSAGDLVGIEALSTNYIAAESVLLEYAHTTGFLLVKDEDNKVFVGR